MASPWRSLRICQDRRSELSEGPVASSTPTGAGFTGARGLLLFDAAGLDALGTVVVISGGGGLGRRRAGGGRCLERRRATLGLRRGGNLLRRPARRCAPASRPSRAGRGRAPSPSCMPVFMLSTSIFISPTPCLIGSRSASARSTLRCVSTSTVCVSFGLSRHVATRSGRTPTKIEIGEGQEPPRPGRRARKV